MPVGRVPYMAGDRRMTRVRLRLRGRARCWPAALALARRRAARPTLEGHADRRADDPRLERSARRARLPRAIPAAPAADGVQLALDDGAVRARRRRRRRRARRAWRSADAPAARDAAARRRRRPARAADRDRPADRLDCSPWPMPSSCRCSTSATPPTACASRTAARSLLHLLPSERMRADALAQALVARKWTQAAAARRPEPARREREPRRRRRRSSATACRLVREQAVQALGRPARARPGQPAAADGRRGLRRGLGRRQRRRVRARAALPHRAAAPGGGRRRAGRAGLACAVRALRRAAGVAPLRQGRAAADDRARLGGVDGRQGAGRGRAPAAPKGPGAAWAHGARRSASARRLQGRAAELSPLGRAAAPAAAAHRRPGRDRAGAGRGRAASEERARHPGRRRAGEAMQSAR